MIFVVEPVVQPLLVRLFCLGLEREVSQGDGGKWGGKQVQQAKMTHNDDVYLHHKPGAFRVNL